jgi:hypothetical protein
MAIVTAVCDFAQSPHHAISPAAVGIWLQYHVQRDPDYRFTSLFHSFHRISARETTR